jgi:hypothetical protein
VLHEILANFVVAAQLVAFKEELSSVELWIQIALDILKLMSTKRDVERINFDSSQGTVVGSCEHDNETSSLITDREFY